MRRAWIAAVCLMAASWSGFCQDRYCTAGICVSGFIRGSAEMHVEYAFGKHWSAAAETSLGYSRLLKGRSTLEKEHDSEFIFDEFPMMTAAEMFTEYVQIRYWTREASGGAYLSSGLRYGSANGLDWTVGAGYRMNIWKGVSAGAEYRTNIIHTLKTGQYGAEGIRIYLNYTFGKTGRHE